MSIGLQMDRRSFVSSVAGLSLLYVTEAVGRSTAGSASRLFPNGSSSVRFPFELLANAIFIRASVNGRGPHLFAVDTGSTNSVIAAELSSELGIASGRQIRTSGAGSDSNMASMLEDLEFGLPGGVVRRTQGSTAISMAGLWPLIGQRIYGIAGYDILRPFVVEIDYAGRHITLHDPASYRYRGRGRTFPARMYGAYDPQIEGALVVPGQQPIPVRFTIDTGAGGTIVSSPLVDRFHLVEAVRRAVRTQDNGVGGAEPSEVLSQLSAIRIGPYALERPIVALSRDRAGSLAEEGISVNIGGNILRRFTLIIDYARHQVTLEPNRHFGEPFRSDASGLLLAAAGADFRTFVVQGVIANSPASESDVREGDLVLAVNGAAANGYTLWQLQEQFKTPGAVLALTLRRGTETLTRRLTLRSLL